MKSITFKKIDVIAAVKKHAILSIIASVFVLALGILMCIIPGYTSATIVWISFGLFALAGCVGIAHFIYPGKGNKRDPYTFVFSLLVVVLFIVLLIVGLNYPANPQEGLGGFANFSLRVIIFISIFYGVFAIINAVLGLCSVSNLEKGQKGVAIASCVISIILGLLMIIFPFIMWIVGVYIAAIYLIIVSIFYIVVAGKAIKEANDAKKAGVKIEADVVEIKDDGKVIHNK